MKPVQESRVVVFHWQIREEVCMHQHIRQVTLGIATITGDLRGAQLRGNEPEVPEPLSLWVLGFGLCALARRCRALGHCGRA